MSTQNKDTRGNLIFIAVMLFGLVAWYAAGKYLWPTNPPPPKPESESAQVDKDKEKQALIVASAVSGLAPPAGQPWSAIAAIGTAQPEKPSSGAAKPGPVVEERVDPEMLKVVTLGAPGSHLTVKLDPKGAGVRQVILNHFQAADPKTGDPAWLDPEHKVKKPLELIPEDKNREIGSFLLYHYADPKGEDFPLDYLGRRLWKRVTPDPKKYEEGEPVQEAAFETTVDGVKITKTFTLRPRDYHVGLEVKMELTDKDAKERVFRYQLTGAHGIPIEGEWYTGTQRNALIGQVDQKGSFEERTLQDLREVSVKAGGDEVTRGDKPICYAMQANQFFASGIAVATKDQDGKDIPDRDFLGQARPVLMQAAVKGKLLSVPDDKAEGDVELVDPAGAKHVFSYSPADIHYATEESKEADRQRVASRLVRGAEVIVVHRSVVNRSGKTREVVTDVLDPTETAPIFQDDMTVEVSTARDDKIIKLRPGIDPETGQPFAVVHKYVLYNGPVKVQLLGDHLFGQEPAVDPSDVTYYLDDLHLNTLTDFPTSAFGRFFSHIGLTRLVIWFTNLMHHVLWWLYSVVQYVLPGILVYGVCILLLTVMVRGLMHPVSRKQARTTMRMQSLKPELDKLKEKFKEDKQGLQMAQMELYRKHGINPLGSCWMMFLQMPVFLGLYYCLQESIHFRLAPFLWIESLTAPDMLFRWPDWVPFINKWENYGSWYYLGPYFNVLPVVAVALMIVTQKYTLPPATDEQQAMQQKWMKYSMILFGLFFYKVAAGLCLYFIASSLWGFAERKLLPKTKPGALPPPVPAGRPTLMQRMMDRLLDAQRQQTGAGNGAAAAPPPPAAPAAGGKKKRGRGPTPAAPAPDGLLAKVRAWWIEVLKQAKKK